MFLYLLSFLALASTGTETSTLANVIKLVTAEEE